MSKIKVLVTGIGAYGIGEGIVKALLQMNYKYYIMASNGDMGTPFFDQVDEAHITPFASDKERFLKALTKLIKDREVQVLIPGSEAELNVINENRVLFKNCILALNNCDLIIAGNNKWSTYKLFREKGIETPRTVVGSSLPDNKIEFGLPYIVKPCVGKSSEDVFVIRKKDYMKVVSKFLKMKGSEYVVQEYLPGPEYTAGIVTGPRGNSPQVMVFERMLKKGASQRVTLVKDENIDKQLRDIAVKLQSTGPLNLQFKLKGSQVAPFEINPRFSGTTPMRAVFGFNEVDMVIESFMGGEMPKPKYNKYVQAQRYYEEVYYTESDTKQMNNKLYFWEG